MVLTLLRGRRNDVIIATILDILKLLVGVFMVVHQGLVEVALEVIFGLMDAMGGILVLIILRLLMLQTLVPPLLLGYLLQRPYLPPSMMMLCGV